MPPSFDLRRPGPLAFPITPFRSDGSLDLDAFARHLDWMLEHEPPALFVACGTGEFASLDVDEVEAVARSAVERAPSGVPVYVGAGGSVPIASRFARAAEAAGADGLLVLPPYLVSGEQDGLVAYYRAVAAATELAVIVYQRDAAVFEPASVEALARIPNVVGFKDGLGDIERLQRIVRRVGGALTYFNGMPTAETFQPAYAAMGVPHYSSAVFNFVPEIAWAFHRAARADDGATVERLLREFFLPLTELRRQVKGYAVALVKAGVALRRGSAGPVRPPITDAAPDHVRQLDAIVERGLAALTSRNA